MRQGNRHKKLVRRSKNGEGGGKRRVKGEKRGGGGKGGGLWKRTKTGKSFQLGFMP